ncbi:MAG: protease [Gammaproteobacteria bacterium]|nr:protease [Gammaproteobacteria bacterium]
MLMKSQKISTRVASYSRTLESKKPNNRILLSRSSYCFSKTEAQAPRFKKVIVNILTCAFLITTNIAQASPDNPSTIENSVIKIYTTQAAPDYFTPWRLLSPRQSSGSGSVIQGNKILTNAHVVANASYVQAQKHNDPRRYLAQVTFISHEADLALLTVEEPGFFDNLTPLAFGTLPAALQEVSVYGYPIGGKSLSITKGILSRVEQQIYAHAGAYLLAGQIDAAINPGNSGGPVIVDGKIVGVVMQASSGGRAENLGYFVPPSMITHVLTDAEDSIYDGFPDLGFRTQNLDSPSAKTSYGLNTDQSGVLVIQVFDGSPASGILKKGDVILKIDEFDIAEDGSIKIANDQMTNFKHAIDLHDIGDQIKIEYSRLGIRNTVTLDARPASRNYSLVPGEKFDEVPKYIIFGGVVFVPLNMNLIKRWGNDWSRSAPVSLLQARSDWSSTERSELVVALQVLAADVNLGYHDWRNWVVEKINGEDIRNFQHFADKLKGNKNEHVVFENKNGYQMIINRAEAISTEDAILNQYRIPKPFSDGLFDNTQSLMYSN